MDYEFELHHLYKLRRVALGPGIGIGNAGMESDERSAGVESIQEELFDRCGCLWSYVKRDGDGTCFFSPIDLGTGTPDHGSIFQFSTKTPQNNFELDPKIVYVKGGKRCDDDHFLVLWRDMEPDKLRHFMNLVRSPDVTTDTINKLMSDISLQDFLHESTYGHLFGTTTTTTTTTTTVPQSDVDKLMDEVRKEHPEILLPNPFADVPQGITDACYHSRVPGKGPFFLAIAGLIGAGKSRLAEALAGALDLQTYLEDVNGNVYLEDFYADMAKYSFQLQVYLLNRRFRQHQEITWNSVGGVQDRTIYEDPIFAKVLMRSGLMTERDYQTYLDLFTNMSNFMKKPNVIVYLEVDPEVAFQRIKERGREMEKGITLEYMVALYNAYEEFITEISLTITVIRVPWNVFRSPRLTATKILGEYYKCTKSCRVSWTDPTGPEGSVASSCGAVDEP